MHVSIHLFLVWTTDGILVTLQPFTLYWAMLLAFPPVMYVFPRTLSPLSFRPIDWCIFSLQVLSPDLEKRRLRRWPRQPSRWRRSWKRRCVDTHALNIKTLWYMALVIKSISLSSNKHGLSRLPGIAGQQIILNSFSERSFQELLVLWALAKLVLPFHQSTRYFCVMILCWFYVYHVMNCLVYFLPCECTRCYLRVSYCGCFFVFKAAPWTWDEGRSINSIHWAPCQLFITGQGRSFAFSLSRTRTNSVVPRNWALLNLCKYCHRVIFSCVETQTKYSIIASIVFVTLLSSISL